MLLAAPMEGNPRKKSLAYKSYSSKYSISRDSAKKSPFTKQTFEWVITRTT